MIRRYLQAALTASLRNFPVVLLTGARQVGKSTLAQAMISEAWPARYLTLDDRTVLDAALRDPDALVGDAPDPVIIDEVQRAPDLLRAIKLAVDRHRVPGRFLLTGSANILTLSRVSESLAGRVGLHTLYPFSWAEKREGKAPSILSWIFEAETAAQALRRLSVARGRADKDQLSQEIMTGGFPPAVLMDSQQARREWFSAYRQTYLERDLFNIQAIEHVPDFNKLLTLAAARTGRLLNMSDLARDCGLPFSTLRRYMGILETTFQVFFVRPYYANIGNRLAKTPKIYFQDTGMAAYLAGFDDWGAVERQAAAGAMAETWTAGELRKLIGVTDSRIQLYFWRTHAGQEVDLLMERAGRLVAIEVKWGNRIDDAAVRNLERCAIDLKGALGLSIVLYGGKEVVALGPRILAVPFAIFFGIAE
ncbi:MAG: ATP-binding protein [Candidatus Aminicenantes bacterium]|nr:ATP-binding protein [Candidatus Aminicenantes bacterium]